MWMIRDDYLMATKGMLILDVRPSWCICRLVRKECKWSEYSGCSCSIPDPSLRLEPDVPVHEIGYRSSDSSFKSTYETISRFLVYTYIFSLEILEQ